VTGIGRDVGSVWGHMTLKQTVGTSTKYYYAAAEAVCKRGSLTVLNVILPSATDVCTPLLLPTDEIREPVPRSPSVTH